MAETGNSGAVRARINEKLTAALAPLSLNVIDETHHHAGHMGHHHDRSETHFRVEVVSAVFSGKGRVERHRMINSLLAEELAGGVHALAIDARAPDGA
ncbi:MULTISPECIES: BolA family protein [Methylosinus]|jgi:BolA protein|uniref:BolA family transcriptional regulator n=1 Tax=Methylosinus trichosporium (strain ATCC 35070 / NCIMB 11131 / UNIQEM 75 / OB3b) TaxID=595536 RepID=A0A2D2CZ40_METT3|nr:MULTISPECIES: BolA family protein [Methylosinus]ATQ68013.1 BolA family transcriptional regulator [Methylosinus trichosporium OB3b]OBS53710.1 BolA family transcriptional regulator [Methylosinus sp. 3S-1]